MGNKTNNPMVFIIVQVLLVRHVTFTRNQLLFDGSKILLSCRHPFQQSSLPEYERLMAISKR